jgi:hypothetical protein
VQSGGRSTGWPAALGAAAAYGALAIWITWPLPQRLSDHVVDTVALHGPFGWLALADIRLVAWALAWDVHALLHAPGALFDANVFHPARWALARSDHFLGNVPLFAPVWLASHNAILAHQAVLLLTFPLSALAMRTAVTAWTRSAAAGFVAGLLFGFGPWRFAQLGHLQLATTFWLPLLLLCAWQTVRTGRARPWLGVVVLGSLQALSSVYLALGAFAAAAAMIVGTWLAAAGAGWRRAGAALGALALAGVPVVALAWPYATLGRLGAIPRVVATAASIGTTLEAAAADPVRTYLFPVRLGSLDGYYFVGWTCAALAALGALAGGRRSGARAGLVLALVTGWILSLGYAWRLPHGGLLPLPLGWLAATLPGLGSLRAPLRLGVTAAFAAAALAGVGYAAAERRVGGRAARGALLAAVAVLALVEATPRAIPLRQEPPGGRVPEVYGWLAAQAGGPVLELPVGFLDRDFLGDVAAVGWQSGYQEFSAPAFWPLLNGYSGYPPESFFFLMAIARRLPAPGAVRDLVELSGVRWVVVHRDALPPDARAVWDAHGDDATLVRRAVFGPDVAFEVTAAPRRDLRPLLRDEAPRPRTLAGLARSPLPPAATRGALDQLQVPAVMLAGGLHQGAVTVRNDGEQPWPGFDPTREGLVGVAYRWRAADGTTTPGTVTTRTGADVLPGASIRLPFAIASPREPGRYELLVTLRQDGGPWFDETAGVQARAPVEVRAWRAP